MAYKESILAVNAGSKLTPLAGRNQPVVATVASIEHGLSNGRIEPVDIKTRLITRIAFDFAPRRNSSPWPCSASAATDPSSPGAKDPHISQESQSSPGVDTS